MISFIVIGRNEGWKLPKCILSIIDSIKFNKLKDYEIIYIDSNSSDGSIERVKEFGIIRIFKLTGNINAAIARNTGAKEAKGDVLFFIDGDMEILPEFLSIVFSKEGILINNFVSGQWINYYYNQLDELIKRERHGKKEHDSFETTTGGLFLINKKTWDLAVGMDIKYKISEDIDLGLRLAKKNIFLLRKKEMAAIHHTISYLDKKRMWQDLYKGNHLYSKSLLYRDHIFNPHIYKRIIRHDYTTLLLILSIAAVFILNKIALIGFFLYLIIVLLRSKFSFKNSVYFFLRDLSIIVGLFIFFPKKPRFIVIKIR